MICPVCNLENTGSNCKSCGTELLSRDLISIEDINEYAEKIQEKLSERTNDFVINDGVLEEYNGTDVIVQIPEGVERIADKCFNRASNDKMKIIIMPKSLKKINTDSCRKTSNPANNGAFEMCESIERVIFREGSQIDEIGNYAFYMCKNLVEIEGLEDKKIYIGNNAFNGCSKSIINKIRALKNAEFADYWAGEES